MGWMRWDSLCLTDESSSRFSAAIACKHWMPRQVTCFGYSTAPLTYQPWLTKLYTLGQISDTFMQSMPGTADSGGESIWATECSTRLQLWEASFTRDLKQTTCTQSTAKPVA